LHKDAQTKTARRAQEDAALALEESDGRKMLLSDRMSQEGQLEANLEDRRKRASDDEEKKAQELAARQDAEMASLKHKHIEERIRLEEENRVDLNCVIATEKTLHGGLKKELDEKATLFEATIQDKMQRLHAARLAEDGSERAAVEQHSSILSQLSVLFQQTQTTAAPSNIHSEFSTSPRAQDIPANNVDAQLETSQLYERKVDDTVYSEGTPQIAPVSPTSDVDPFARLDMLMECNKRENEEVFGPYLTVTPPHGEKRPHESEQSGATGSLSRSPSSPGSSASTLDCIVVEAPQTPKRPRLGSPSNGGAVAATSPSPSTLTSTSKLMDAPHEKAPGSASRFTFAPIRDALLTPSPTPSTPASPSPAVEGFNSKGYLTIPIKKYPPGTRTPQKVSKSPAKSRCSTSAPLIPTKIYSVRHFRSTKPDDTCQWSSWSPTPKRQNFSIKRCGQKFEPLPVKGWNGKLLPPMPAEFNILPLGVWKFEYGLTEALVYMKRTKTDGQHAWIEFKDRETLEAFLNEYKSRWPDNVVVERYELAPHTHLYIIAD
jgi:hypothetical protein